MINRRSWITALASIGMASPKASVWAQAYPSRPIRWIVTFPPGGGSDVTARILQEPMSRALGQPIIIDNRGGAGGAVGTEIAARSAADGYTLLYAMSSHTILPALQKLPFDVERDFAAVGMAVDMPQMIFASPQSPFSTLKEMVAYARGHIGELSFASVGNGSPAHIAGELLKQMADIYMVHIPYRGGGPAVVDVMAGQLDLGIVSLPAVAAQAKAGRVKPLAVTSRERAPGFPDVPTVAEALAMPAYNVDSWYAFFAPTAVPPEVIKRFNAELIKVLALPEVKKSLLLQGAVATSDTPEQLDLLVHREVKRWKELVVTRKIKAD